MIVSDIPGTTRDAIDTRLAYGQGEVVLIDTAGIRRRGKVASAAGGRALLHAARAARPRPGRRRRPRHRRRRGAHRAGRPRRRLRRRGGQGPRHRGQQVGPRRGEDRPDLRPVRRLDPPRGAVPRLRRRSSRSARRPASESTACSSWPSTSGASVGGGSAPAELNRLVAEAVARQVPPTVRNRRPKLLYATQAAIAPPTFVFFASDADD